MQLCNHGYFRRSALAQIYIHHYQQKGSQCDSTLYGFTIINNFQAATLHFGNLLELKYLFILKSVGVIF